MLLILCSIVVAIEHVRVTNRMAKEIKVHCMSGDDNFKIMTLAEDEFLEWSFNDNIFGTTLFYCNVQWDGGKWLHFDAYSSHQNIGMCFKTCYWAVSNDGCFSTILIGNTGSRDHLFQLQWRIKLIL
ncbi:hypothetical protein GIB67_000664 [Kingdonia uniflora]|uniref:S-protein homolog n=1 Tax=Kingdonia uniflora TaxID=39325 RepID=A0A7J7NDJ6_9MAGN|nr:hypothetical protein GIB67_000664 [Kingdonia uniflora]